MNWIGKILGGITGGWLAGPWGMILGLIIGHWLDKYYFVLNRPHSTKTNHQAQQEAAFLRITFCVLGHIAKADGRISSAEIQQARQIMAQLNLSKAARYQAMRYFYVGKRSDFALGEALDQLQTICPRRWLNFFLTTQIKMAWVDGYLHTRKKQLLMFIAKRLEIPLPGNQETHAKQESSTHHAQSRNPPDPLQQAYQLLGISSHATHVEIKKAYRRAMNYNHPDKLIAKGLPEKVIRQATQKTQQIRAAYESICQARRI